MLVRRMITVHGTDWSLSHMTWDNENPLLDETPPRNQGTPMLAVLEDVGQEQKD